MRHQAGWQIGAAVLGVLASLAPATLADALAPWHLTLVLSATGLFGWVLAYRRYRHYADTPSAPVGSAPQGYIAIEGIGRPLPGAPLLSPFNYLPCLWYRVRVQVRDSDGDWRTETDETSDASFVLEDEDGSRCVIDPLGARVEVRHKDEMHIDDRRTTQWLLIPGTRLQALGHFESSRPADDLPDFNADLREKLADWKDGGIARRFDADGEGELSLVEWEQAREAARQEVEQERAAVADFPPQNILRKPADGRPFVISDHPPEQVLRRYHRQAIVILVLTALAFVVTAWLATHS